jgi:uncharacterized membrane protein (DUF373 family)
VVRTCEVVVVSAAAFILIASVLLAAGLIYVLLFDGLRDGNLATIQSTKDLQTSAEHVFAGILLLLLGLELLQTLTSYFLGHHLQLELIVVVAMIAAVRHVMLIDFEHEPPMSLFGIAALILALAISFALVRKRNSQRADELDE